MKEKNIRVRPKTGKRMVLQEVHTDKTHVEILSHLQEDINPNYTDLPSRHGRNGCHHVKKDKERQRRKANAHGVLKRALHGVGGR